MKHHTLPIIIERDTEGFYVSCPTLKGCYSHGDTYDEALSKIEDAIRLHLEDRQEDRAAFAENSPHEDPLLALRGSGRELWADEHADDYVRRLRGDWK